MSTQTRAFISEKDKVARNEKRKKLHGFSYYKNIANFEAFQRDKNFSKKPLFLESDKAAAFVELKSSQKKKSCIFTL